MAGSIRLNLGRPASAAVTMGRAVQAQRFKGFRVPACPKLSGNDKVSKCEISRDFIGFCVVASGARSAAGQPLDKVRFGTNWVAEAEHGGFYQALADGTYKKYGLDVTIVPGGPNVNNRILLPVGKLDFFMSANSLQTFDAVEHNIPTVAVAASFQKDPQVLIAHPGRAEIRRPQDAARCSSRRKAWPAISSG